MATDGPGNATSRTSPSDAVWRLPRLETRLPSPELEALAPLDLIDGLDELQRQTPSLESNGLADALLDWLTPRPSRPEILSQGRIAPLLGAAADLLARSASAMPDIASVGARALEQELRDQRALAERRASLQRDRPE